MIERHRRSLRDATAIADDAGTADAARPVLIPITGDTGREFVGSG
jgi:hypothetical protein